MYITNVKCLTPITPGAIVELKLDGGDEPAKASKFSIPDIAIDWGKHAAMTRMSPRHHPKADWRHNMQFRYMSPLKGDILLNCI